MRLASYRCSTPQGFSGGESVHHGMKFPDSHQPIFHRLQERLEKSLASSLCLDRATPETFAAILPFTRL